MPLNKYTKENKLLSMTVSILEFGELIATQK